MGMMSRIPNPADFRVVEKLPTDASVLNGAPDVTVVTVVFNAVKDGRHKRFLQCLDSAQTQIGCRVEHLIVDGASADGTVTIVEQYANHSVPIRYLSQPDHGLYEAMNRGIALARGKYIVFLNSDDRFTDPEGLSTSLAALESTGADFSYAPLVYVNESGRPVDHYFATADESRTLFSGMTICHQTILMRREVLRAVDGFDCSYRSAADYDLLLRVIYAGYRGVRVPKRFVEFQCGGFSARHEELSEGEVDLVFQRLLREKLNVDIPRPALRCMRRNGEWPPRLAEQIRQIGERAFGCPLPPATPTRPQWEKCTKWRASVDLAALIWHRYAPATTEASVWEVVLSCLHFSACHPIHAFGAIKAWIVHRKDDPLPIWKWMEIRCMLMVERLAQRNWLVYPADCVVDEGGEWRSMRGLICTDVLRVEHSFAGLSRRARLLIVLSSSVLQDHVSVVEVRIHDTIVGRLVLEPYASVCYGDFPLPMVASESRSLPIELKMVGGGRFVFGGLCLESVLRFGAALEVDARIHSRPKTANTIR